jgi:hypothetical protein
MWHWEYSIRIPYSIRQRLLSMSMSQAMESLDSTAAVETEVHFLRFGTGTYSML